MPQYPEYLFVLVILFDGGVSVSPRFRATYGAIVPGSALYQRIPGTLQSPSVSNELDIPTEFDARVRFPSCAKVIGHIRDQSHCGSCWAVGSVGAFNGRYCIATGDNVTVLSADDPLANCNSTFGGGGEMSTCVNPNGGGCDGGQLEFVWQWYVEYGTVPGTGYLHRGFDGEVDQTCAPYPFPPCHERSFESDPACNGTFETPGQFATCPNSYARGHIDYWKSKVRARGWYGLPNSTRAIQADIMKHGSVSIQVQATCSMKDYTWGVYVPSGKVCGGHVMRAFGWGIEGGLDFWWLANSWGSEWGINGTIKWIRGVDAQGIESGAVAGSIAPNNAKELIWV